MCFSAGASFGAAAVLSIVGSVAVIKAKTIPQGLFAAIPFIFSIQQVAEGMLWLSFNNDDMPGRAFFIYVFLVFAIMFWPIWIPLTTRLLEKDITRKKILTMILIAGIIVSAGFACIILFYPLEAVATHHHIQYKLDLPPAINNLMWLFNILYFTTTIISTFISSIKRMKLLGTVFIAAYLFSIYFYNGAVLSVWCYFAALLSIVILWIVSEFRIDVQQKLKATI
ncbi:MAG TPA: DUF6629 family protein [Chitinophagaceae bacterium]|jgi:hypothetical protein|nr:DUF6629 family protein [Chitinophagaceae bacterium]